MRRLKSATLRAINNVFERLDYRKLGHIYCAEGGEAFWADRREPCRELGINLAETLLNRLTVGGRSLYVGAGVAEIPILMMELLDLGRKVTACNLRAEEVTLLNQACKTVPFQFSHVDARSVKGVFDHLWMVSVLNDPEQFPEVSALSYGRANPATFDNEAFARQREAVIALAAGCLRKLARPALVTTSVEEIPWIMEWSRKANIGCVVEDEDFPTALVGDPACFIRLCGR